MALTGTLPGIIHKGSVKNVRGVKDGGQPYVFEYSDRYSIFDWGEMPDHLDGKGDALAFMGWFFFQYLGDAANWKDWQPPAGLGKSAVLRALREKGAPHHMRGLVTHDLRPQSLDREALAPTRFLSVNPVAVIEPASRRERGKLVWDYGAYKEKPENALVPLEVIFRFGVPDGSSLLKRTGDAAYRRSLGLTVEPKPGDMFETPVIEMSTKLEPADRYIAGKEAQAIAGLSDEEFSRLRDLAALLALRLKDCFAGIGVELWDGKFEFAFGAKDRKGQREFILVDSIGPDELRLIYRGVHLSKEMLRAFYRPTAWCEALDRAKEIAKERGERDWKRICTEEMKLVPPMLSPAVKEKAEMAYKGLCRALSEKYCGKVVFASAWDLDTVAARFGAGKEETA